MSVNLSSVAFYPQLHNTSIMKIGNDNDIGKENNKKIGV
jgi:hypothetical protein